MNIVSFVIGTNGLVAITRAAFDITRTIREVGTFPEDMNEILSQVAFETTKVRRWAKAAEIRMHHKGPSSLGQCDQDLVNMHQEMIQLCAARIGSTMADIEKVVRKYALVAPTEAGGSPQPVSSNEAATTQNSSARDLGLSVHASAVITAASPAVPRLSQALRTEVWSMQSATKIRALSTRKKLGAVCKPWGVADKESLERNVKKLESWNNRIYSLFPASEITELDSLVRTLLVRDHDDIRNLESIGRVAKAQNPEVSKTTALAIQVLDPAHNCQYGSCVKYRIAYPRLRMQEGGLGSFGFLDTPTTAPEKTENINKGVLVLVEWLNYSGLDSFQQEVALDRIHALCHILDAEKPNSLQTLRFIGYVQRHDDKNIGMVSSIDEQSQLPVSLYQILSREKTPSGSSYPKLMLHQRFSLALQLSKVFLELHTARWLHRGFSSHSVLLQASSDSLQCEKIAVCGFQYARQSGRTEVSLPLDDAELTQRMWYLHPDVRHGLPGSSNSRDGYTRYQARHDVFSLGIVLIEIGMGKPLEQLLKPDRIQDADRERFMKSLRSLGGINLPITMGQRYAEIVDQCLLGRPNSTTASLEVSKDCSLEDDDSLLELTPMLEHIVKVLEECNGYNL